MSRLGNPSAPDLILREMMRRVQARKIRMTMIAAERSPVQRLPVSPGEAIDLELRITGDSVAPVILWSRSRQEPVGTAPWFSRTDVLRAWPERMKKSAAVVRLILRHLEAISTSERPLTRAQATSRCLAEVPGAYPEAVKAAWALLDSSLKRGRGKHGPRVH